MYLLLWGLLLILQFYLLVLYSSIFKRRNSLIMWVFLGLQALQVGLENDLSPDNFTWCCLGFLWVFHQKWVQRDVNSALPRADGN